MASFSVFSRARLHLCLPSPEDSAKVEILEDVLAVEAEAEDKLEGVPDSVVTIAATSHAASILFIRSFRRFTARYTR